MAEQTNNKPYYLKVVPLRDVPILNAKREVNNYIKNEFLKSLKNFGFLKEVLSLNDSIVYQFTPFSREGCIPDAYYKTRQEALESAISFFNKRGFRAITFDLEKMIDGVK